MRQEGQLELRGRTEQRHAWGRGSRGQPGGPGAHPAGVCELGAGKVGAKRRWEAFCWTRLPWAPAMAGIQGNPDPGQSLTGRPWHSLHAGAPNLIAAVTPFSFGVFNGKQRLQRISLDGCFVMTICEYDQHKQGPVI